MVKKRLPRKFLRRYLNTIQRINRYPIDLNELKFKLPKTRLKRIGYNDIWLEQFDTFMVTRLRCIKYY